MGVSAAVDVIGGAAAGAGVDAAAMGLIGPTMLGAAGATDAALGAAALGSGLGGLATDVAAGGLGLGSAGTAAALGDVGSTLSTGALDYVGGGNAFTSNIPISSYLSGTSAIPGAPGVDLGSTIGGIGSTYSPVSSIGANVAGAVDAATGAGGSGLLNNLKNISNIASVGSNLYSGLFGPQGQSPDAAKLAADPFAPYRTADAQKLQDLMNNPNLAYSLPGYQSAQRQGRTAVNRNAAAAGTLVSGNTLGAITDTTSNIANQWFNNYVSTLSGLSGATQAPAYGQNAYNQAVTNQSLAQANQQKQLLAGLAGVGTFFS
jgi:hypothetical protein